MPVIEKLPLATTSNSKYLKCEWRNCILHEVHNLAIITRPSIRGQRFASERRHSDFAGDGPPPSQDVCSKVSLKTASEGEHFIHSYPYIFGQRRSTEAAQLVDHTHGTPFSRFPYAGAIAILHDKIQCAPCLLDFHKTSTLQGHFKNVGPTTL
jgi:hypothetical protein